MAKVGKHAPPCSWPAPSGGARCPGCGGFGHNPGNIIVRGPGHGTLRGLKVER